MTDIERLAAETNDALQQAYEFNRVLWAMLISNLDHEGVVNKNAFAKVLESAAVQANDKNAAQLSAMFLDLADLLRDPAAPTKLRFGVVKGGKDE